VIASLAILAAGCSTSSPRPAASSPSPLAGVSLTASPVASPQLDAAWTLHSDAAESFAIAFPDTWNFVFRDSPSYDADLKAVNNADLIKFFGEGFRAGQSNGLKLIAAEPRSAQSGFVTNLSVFRTDLGPSTTAPSLDSIASSKLNLFSKQQGLIGEVKRQQVRVPAGTFEQLQYSTKPNDKTVNISTYLGTTEAADHRYLIEVIVGTNVQDSAGLFDRIVKTFRLISPPAPTPLASPSVSPSPHR
jgi:hypothetical protein